MVTTLKPVIDWVKTTVAVFSFSFGTPNFTTIKQSNRPGLESRKSNSCQTKKSNSIRKQEYNLEKLNKINEFEQYLIKILDLNLLDDLHYSSENSINFERLIPKYEEMEGEKIQIPFLKKEKFLELKLDKSIELIDLETLAEEMNVPPRFFLDDEEIRNNPNLLRELLDYYIKNQFYILSIFLLLLLLYWLRKYRRHLLELSNLKELLLKISTEKDFLINELKNKVTNSQRNEDEDKKKMKEALFQFAKLCEYLSEQKPELVKIINRLKKPFAQAEDAIRRVLNIDPEEY
jgi:hypothetical protein